MFQEFGLGLSIGNARASRASASVREEFRIHTVSGLEFRV